MARKPAASSEALILAEVANHISSMRRAFFAILHGLSHHPAYFMLIRTQMQKVLDSADRRILREMQRDSSRSVAQLAEAVGLSHAPCWRRLQRLRADGFIVRESAVLGRSKLGWEVELFVSIKVSPNGRANIEEFRRSMMLHDRVIGYYIVLGNVDAMFHIVARNLADYNQFYLEHLAASPYISEISTMTILSQLKDTDIPV